MTDKEQREEVQREIRATRDAIRDEKKDHLARFAEVANDKSEWWKKSYLQKEGGR